MLPLHAGAGEAGKVRWPLVVLCYCAGHWDSQAGWGLRLPAGAQQAPVPPDLGGHAMLHPQGHRHSHHEQRLPSVYFLPPVVRKKIPDTPVQHWEAQEEPLYSGHLDPKWGCCLRITLRLFLITLLFKVTTIVNIIFFTYFYSFLLFYFTLIIVQLKELMVTHVTMIVPWQINLNFNLTSLKLHIHC